MFNKISPWDTCSITPGTKFMTNLIPFKLKVSNEDLEDLNRRLNNTRLPDKPPIEAWKTGTDITWFKKLLNYWKNDYDWKKSEEELNTFDQFKININDIDVHFIKSEGKGKNNYGGKGLGHYADADCYDARGGRR